MSLLQRRKNTKKLLGYFLVIFIIDGLDLHYWKER